MPTGFEQILGRLAQRDLILPYFESSIMSHQWPEFYDIRVDSRPYYGAGDGYFHPSTHPMMGERELYYTFHPDTRGSLIPERRTLFNEMILTMGSAIHAVLQTQMTLAGLIKNPETDIEREYVNKAHHVRGRIDWIVSHPNGSTLPVEFKTQNTWDYKRQTEPKPEWLAQLNLGLDACDQDLGILLIAERGGMMNMREFQVHRDPLLLAEIYEKFDRVRAAIAANEPPRHCCPPDSAVMEKCPARYSCWLANG